jgi:hypothetical protein
VLEEGVVVGPGVVLGVSVGERLNPCYHAHARGSSDRAGVGEGAVGGELQIEACVSLSGGGNLRGQVEGGRGCGGLDELGKSVN